MATPKGIQGVSTPKNPVTSTPTRSNASPRPNPGAFAQKTLAYKSPAVKTPSSLHGHSHRVSISSHPTSTPLAAPAIHDELLNLNSPAAALIASIGNTGLTPIATGQDGLGITSGITPQPARDLPSAPRNPERDRLSRLQQVAKLLKGQTAGRGITRDGVERIAQIHGFTILWDEENLTIAGNKVDLEIIFDATLRDVVRDVQLRLNTSASEEPLLQKNASEVLKRHLTHSPPQHTRGEAWRSLREFSQDLEYLSQLDYADSPANCFELIDGLYTAFRKVWDGEKKRMRDRQEAYHICQSNVGLPQINGDSLGITTKFWVDKHSYHELTDTLDETFMVQSKHHEINFSCERRKPGINSNCDWLDAQPLKTSVTTEDVFQESQVGQPNWNTSSLTEGVADQQKDADAMMIDGAVHSGPGDLSVCFICTFRHPVFMPLNRATNLNTQYPMVDIDQNKAFTYQQALLDEVKSMQFQTWNTDIRWQRSVAVFSEQGQASKNTHSYSLFSANVLWGYQISELRFSHPKQYADALPVLRQCALLWSILHNSLIDKNAPSISGSDFADLKSTHQPSEHSAIRRRSNKKPAQIELETLLASATPKDATLKVNMSLNVLNDASRARLEVIIPVPVGMSDHQSDPFICVIIEVCLNGLIEIPSIRGLRSAHEDKLRRKAVQVLSLCEDVSVLVEWLLGEVKKPSH